MQDDVKAVERLTGVLCRYATAYDRLHRDIADDFRKAADTLAALQERYERLEQAARAALPWVTGEAEATALEEALTAPRLD